jgi:hypothetical protein
MRGPSGTDPIPSNSTDRCTSTITQEHFSNFGEGRHNFDCRQHERARNTNYAVRPAATSSCGGVSCASPQAPRVSRQLRGRHGLQKKNRVYPTRDESLQKGLNDIYAHHDDGGIILRKSYALHGVCRAFTCTWKGNRP